MSRLSLKGKIFGPQVCEFEDCLNREVHSTHESPLRVPISVPVSPSIAVECYPCREVPLNYSDSYLFHGGNTGSIPVRDANTFNHFFSAASHLASSFAISSGLLASAPLRVPLLFMS